MRPAPYRPHPHSQTAGSGSTHAPSAVPPGAITDIEAETGPGSGLVRLYWPSVTDTAAPVTHY